MPPPCAACAAPAAALACARCKCAFYCAAACQRAAWGAHKGVCVAGAAGGLPALGKWPEPHHCSMCGAGGVRMLCLGCGCASYCDEQCQRAAWGAHRDACRAAAAAPKVKDAHEQSRCSHCDCETPYHRKMCGRCHTVSYCGEACARAHWTAGGHRGACTAAGHALFSFTVSQAEAGDRESMFFCGLYYMRGVGVAADAASALVWYTRAAEAGDADAQFNLGCCYREGTGVAVDAAAAVKWFTRVAEAGHVNAQFNLGLCYREGSGVAADAAAAVKWFARAADAGNDRAIHSLAMCYEEGTGVAVDFAKSIALYTRAAEAGHAGAQYHLGMCYLKGKCGVARDLAKAREWLSRAAAGGHTDAAALLAPFDAGAAFSTCLRGCGRRSARPRDAQSPLARCWCR